MTDLWQLSREGGANFVLPLQGAPEFAGVEIVRRVPDRRLVCRGIWNGREAFAKIFIGTKAGRYATRDARGMRALAAAGIPAPRLLHEGGVIGQPGLVLVYAAVADSRNAEQVWQAADAIQRRLLAVALVNTVARHHAAGLIQTDLYLRNFLCSGAEIYTLDGDGIRIARGPVGWRRSMVNLALLLSKFDVEQDEFIPDLLAAYVAARAWPERACDLSALKSKVRELRREVAQQYAGRKVLRECTDVQVRHGWSRFVAVARAQLTDELQRVLDDPDAWLDDAACRRLKNGNTCTVGLVQADERQIVIKRYNIKNFWHGLNRALRRTRASISWSNAHLLGMVGIATPPPLALIENRCGPLRRQSYFLAEYAEGPDIAEVFADASVSWDSKREAAGRVAQLLHRLYALGIAHGDMKATNLKIVDGKPLLIDLDGLRQHRCGWWFRRRHARDLRRLLKNWHNAPQVLQMVISALVQAYANDPVLKMAGIDIQGTSENT